MEHRKQLTILKSSKVTHLREWMVYGKAHSCRKALYRIQSIENDSKYK